MKNQSLGQRIAEKEKEEDLANATTPPTRELPCNEIGDLMKLLKEAYDLGYKHGSRTLLTLLLFFLSVACLPSVYAAPAALGLTNSDGDQLPDSRFLNENAGVYPTSGTDYTLSSGVEGHARPIPTRLHTSGSGAEREGTGKNREQRLSPKLATSSGSEYRNSPTQNFACPQGAASPASLDNPKISCADMFARLLLEGRVKWYEPTFKDLGIH